MKHFVRFSLIGLLALPSFAFADGFRCQGDGFRTEGQVCWCFRRRLSRRGLTGQGRCAFGSALSRRLPSGASMPLQTGFNPGKEASGHFLWFHPSLISRGE